MFSDNFFKKWKFSFCSFKKQKNYENRLRIDIFRAFWSRVKIAKKTSFFCHFSVVGLILLKKRKTRKSGPTSKCSKNAFPWPILVIFLFFERTEAKFSFFEKIISKHQFLPKLWPFEVRYWFLGEKSRFFVICPHFNVMPFFQFLKFFDDFFFLQSEII